MIDVLCAIELNAFIYFTGLIAFGMGVLFYRIVSKVTFYRRYAEELRQQVHKTNTDLKETNKKLKAIYNSSTDVNVLIDNENRIMAFNRSAASFMEDITGKQSLIVGADFFSYVSDVAKDSFKICLDIAASGKKIVFVENFRLFKSTLHNKNIWLLIVLHPVEDDEGKIEGVSMNITDITRRKDIEDAILKQNLHLKKIAWIQSHQIRRPLANIMGLAELLKDENCKHDEILMDKMLQSAHELDDYVKQIVHETAMNNKKNW